MNSYQPLNENEFGKLVEKYFSALTLFAWRWAPDVAEDVAQTTFLKLLKHGLNNGMPDNIAAWLFQTAKRTAIDESRKVFRFRRFCRRYQEDVDTLFEESPETVVYGREISERLKTLPEEARQIVLLRIWGNLSFEEIATVVGIPKTSVFREYTRALEVLRTFAKVGDQ